MRTLASAQSLSSGKGHRDENFPVASFLIGRRHRPVILTFYRFARAADDIADHPGAGPEEKLRLLDGMRHTLEGESDVSPEASALRKTLAEKELSPRHALDLLEAFRRDVTKRRYADWDELIDYCRFSAMPVGRFVLDVHGEARTAWPASDALCAALQLLNHLQDCGKDYRDLDRVYIPLDLLHENGIEPSVLNEARAPPALRNVLAIMARRTASLLAQSRPFASRIADFRLALEVAVIQRLAEDLNRRLLVRDPLSQRVHHRPAEAAGLALVGAARFAATRPLTKSGAAQSPLVVATPSVATETELPAARQTASGSSFYMAMRLLPKDAREAMYAIYGYCRAVDDIADDGAGLRVERGAQLDSWRRDIEGLYAGSSPPRTMFLNAAVRRYALRKEDFLAVIDGMAMDVAEDICAPGLATLDLYCERVASAVGRLSIKVFGMEEQPGFRLAHHLGRALQLTNILRDLDEDAALGRLYLPRELLEGASVAIADPARTIASPAIDPVCHAVAGMARQHYRDANTILRSRPGGDLRAPRLMSAVYATILAEMEKQGWSPPRRRARLAKPRLLWLLLRYGLAA
ncbi:MAG TPA: squalene synthase HpnC [Rhizomicrobium sp.]